MSAITLLPETSCQSKERVTIYIAQKKSHKLFTYAYLPNKNVKLLPGWEWSRDLDGEIRTDDVTLLLKSKRYGSKEQICEVLCTGTDYASYVFVF